MSFVQALLKPDDYRQAYIMKYAIPEMHERIIGIDSHEMMIISKYEVIMTRGISARYSR